VYSIQITMKIKPLIVAAAFAISASTAAVDKLADAFRDPAEETKPWFPEASPGRDAAHP
jgi:hypothetical protein